MHFESLYRDLQQEWEISNVSDASSNDSMLAARKASQAVRKVEAEQGNIRFDFIFDHQNGWVFREFLARSLLKNLSLQNGPANLPPRPLSLGRGASQSLERITAMLLFQNAALVLPHVGLVVLTLIYIVFGAVAFYFLERPFEFEAKSAKITEIKDLQRQYLTELYAMAKNTDKETFKIAAREMIKNLSVVTMSAFVKEGLKPKEINENVTEPAWSWTSAVFFSTVVMTTIGYGSIVPKTYWGKLFCLFYAMFGIPLALVTIADMSKFLALFIGRIYKRCRRISRKHLVSIRFNRAATLQRRLSKKISETMRPGKQSPASASINEEQLDIRASVMPIPPAAVLLVLAAYTAFGALVYSYTESWQYGPAYYFCFITMTTIGFGDLVPKDNNFVYMLMNFAYIVLGLVLMTMSVDIVGSHYIREIHYVGRKISSMKELIALLGGKAASVNQVVANLKLVQRQYGITDAQVQSLLSHPEFRDFISRPRETVTALSSPDPRRGMPRPFVPINVEKLKFIDTARMSETSSMSGVEEVSARPKVHLVEPVEIDSDMCISLISTERGF